MTNLKKGLQVFIMAHHRQEETLRAIDALLNINFGIETQIVLSDNAETEEHQIANVPPGVIHRIRKPPGGSLWHANQIFQELEYEWSLITHDDDELLQPLGDLFIKYSSDPEVGVITGLSRIIGRNGEVQQDEGYLKRLRQAKLLDLETKPRRELSSELFKLGPLFPASAIIVRTEILKDNHRVNPDFELAGDFGFSIEVAGASSVVFEGRVPVMNYHIHGGNSVFSSAAAGGLMSDFTIVRFDYLANSELEITPGIKSKMTKATLVSRILSRAFGLENRYHLVLQYAKQVERARGEWPIHKIGMVPIVLGPLKPFVRRLMWRRLGIKKWKA